MVYVYVGCDDIDFNNKIEENRLFAMEIEKQQKEIAPKLWKWQIVVGNGCDGMASQSQYKGK